MAGLSFIIFSLNLEQYGGTIGVINKLFFNDSIVTKKEYEDFYNSYQTV